MQTHIIIGGVVANTIVATVEEAAVAYPDATVVGAAGGGAIGDLYDPETGAFSRPPGPPLSLDERRAAVVEAINGHRATMLTAGAPHGGKLFAMDDTSRTDLGGMATTAALVLAGALLWPDDYATGWISLDNTRLPLPTPQDGIALAAAVAGRYAAIIQRARDLKDAALASDDPESIDIEAGWPS